MEEMKASEIEREILILYTLIFCVDFMSEKGMKFKDKIIEVNKCEVEELNKIYEKMYRRLSANY